MKVRVGAAQRPMVGQAVCGDGYLIQNGPILSVGVVDGLGHGPDAAEAAQAFISYLQGRGERDVETLLRGLDLAMSATRGGMAALVRFDGDSDRLSFGGVGNIGLQSHGADAIRPISVSGILGKSVRKLRVFDYELTGPLTLYLYSDGISSRFDATAFERADPQHAAQALLDRFGKAHDDATVVVLRFEQEGHAERGMRERGAPDPEPPKAHRILQEFDAVWCSQACRAYAEQVGFSAKAAWEIAICVSELVKNAARHAGGGVMTVRLVKGERRGLEVEISDRGPGIPDVDSALLDGYSRGRRLAPEEAGQRGNGLGVGLGASKRLMDELEVSNQPGGGLRVRARKWA